MVPCSYNRKSSALLPSNEAGNGYDPGTLRQGYPGRHSKQCDETSGVEMIEARKYAVVFERSEDGYGAFVPDLPGCITVGNTLEETERNIREAITGHIEAMRAHGESIPMPTTLTEYIEVPVAIGQ